MVRVVEVAAPVFEIYSLNSRAPITIGSSAENLIIYDNGNAISEVHAAIMSKGEAHYLEDKSCNGIYINHRRMEGRSVLRFGDQIHIFGLLIVYLGNCIALDVSAAGLRIQNELLSLEISAMESVLTAALKIHNDMEGGAVFEAGFSGGNETVLKKLVGEEDETVLERLINEEDETVLERLTEEDDETALERLSDEEDDTVLERLTEEEDETALERLTDEEDETVFGRSRQTGN